MWNVKRDIAVGWFVHKRSFSNLSFNTKIVNRRDVFPYALSITTQLPHFWKKKTLLVYNYSASLHYENSYLKGIMWLNGTQIFVIHITCNRLIIQYFIQQTAQSVTNKHMSLVFILHISIYERASLGTYIQRYTSTANSVKGVCLCVCLCVCVWVCRVKIKYSTKVTKNEKQ